MASRRRTTGVVALSVLAACSTQSGADDVDSSVPRSDVAGVAADPTSLATLPWPVPPKPPTAAATVPPASGGAPATFDAPPAPTTAGGAAPSAPPTGGSNTCSDGMALDDPDGDGWGVCAPTGPLDPVTVVWWSKVGAFRKALCDSGYDAANRMSMVPGGLDRPTYEFLCTTLAPDGAASSEA